ncbi:MAG: ATP-binding cassette domain-containing protein [Spirochaetaceae bacterium]
MVELTSVSFSYGKRAPLFDGLDLALEPGSIYGLLGKNGAGKTSLLRIIAGMLFPDSGRAEVLGCRARDRRPEMLADLFIVPEEFYLPGISAGEYVAAHGPFYPRFDYEILGSCLEEFALDTDTSLAAMSFGQRKKFLIAFALATRVSLVLFDEPTNALDIPGKSQLRKLLLGHMSDERAFVISTHQVRDLAPVMDPISIIDDGRLVFQAGMDRIDRGLRTRVVPKLPGHGVLYSEDALGGHAVLEAAPSEGRPVDIEVLFNAVMHDAAAVRAAVDSAAEPQHREVSE